MFRKAPGTAIVKTRDIKPNGLIDTGAILALLDCDDSWHRPCVETFRRMRLPLLTSEAVLTELFHLVGDRRHEVEAATPICRPSRV